jgi:predicted nicotinamide N-methyase
VAPVQARRSRAPAGAAGEPGGPAAEFIRAHTRPAAPPLLPEIVLRLSSEEPTVLWERLESATGRADLAPPFWAYPWAGGIALARYLLDHRQQVAGRAVLDLAAGSGLVAIAAALAGAARVTASDIDPVAVAAIGLNAAANGMQLAVTTANLLTVPAPPGAVAAPGDGPAADAALAGAELVLVGDAFYERRLAHGVLGFLGRARAAGARVLVGDPGRTYLPSGLREVASYAVPAWPGLEDTDVKETVVWELR